MQNTKPIKMLVVCPHPENVAPGQRLKYEQYFNYFRENGIELTIKPFQTKRFWDIVFRKGHFAEKVFWVVYGYLHRFLLLFTLRRYDVIYVFLWVTPFGKPVFEWLYSLVAKKMIYDIDDLVYLGKTSKNNSWVAMLKGKQKPAFLMKVSEHVITCTPYLDNYARQFNDQTTDISSTVDTDRYLPVNTYSNDHTLTIGWSGSFSTSIYFRLLAPVLAKLKQKYEFHILVMGDKTLKIEGLDIETVAWTDAAEIPTLSRFDIGVYPLPDEQWVYGKSGLKAIQYMALGIPTVASAIGTIFRVIEDGDSGLLVNTDDEWYDALEKLIFDPVLRAKIGISARKKVENEFSINANKDVYLNIIRTVVAGAKVYPTLHP